MLPATVARFWSTSLTGMIVISTVVATLSGFIGLIVSYHASVASGPAIVLTASAFYLFSLFFGRSGFLHRLFPRAHLSG
jgi:zinc/manganese transport system permease protein